MIKHKRPYHRHTCMPTYIYTPFLYSRPFQTHAHYLSHKRITRLPAAQEREAAVRQATVLRGQMAALQDSLATSRADLTGRINALEAEDHARRLAQGQLRGELEAARAGACVCGVFWGGEGGVWVRVRVWG